MHRLDHPDGIGVIPDPVGEESDFPGGESLVLEVGGHAIVAFAVEAGVGGIVDDADDPFAGAPAGEVGGGRIFIGFAEGMAIGAAEGVDGMATALGDEGGIGGIGGGLGWEGGFSGDGGDHGGEGAGIGGVLFWEFFADVLDHLAVLEAGAAVIDVVGDAVGFEHACEPGA